MWRRLVKIWIAIQVIIVDYIAYILIADTFFDSNSFYVEKYKLVQRVSKD